MIDSCSLLKYHNHHTKPQSSLHNRFPWLVWMLRLLFHFFFLWGTLGSLFLGVQICLLSMEFLMFQQLCISKKWYYFWPCYEIEDQVFWYNSSYCLNSNQCFSSLDDLRTFFELTKLRAWDMKVVIKSL